MQCPVHQVLYTQFDPIYYREIGANCNCGGLSPEDLTPELKPYDDDVDGTSGYPIYSDKTTIPTSEQTLCIHDSKDPGSGGKNLESIKSVKDFLHDKIKLDTHAVIYNTLSLNKVIGTEENRAQKNSARPMCSEAAH